MPRPLKAKSAATFLGLESDTGEEHADTFRRDFHPDLRADYVLAPPPVNDSDWVRKDDDVRWQPSGARQIAKGNPEGERGGVHQFGVPPKDNTNFAWVRHFIHAGFNTLADVRAALLPKPLSGELKAVN